MYYVVACGVIICCMLNRNQRGWQNTNITYTPCLCAVTYARDWKRIL